MIRVFRQFDSAPATIYAAHLGQCSGWPFAFLGSVWAAV